MEIFGKVNSEHTTEGVDLVAQTARLTLLVHAEEIDVDWIVARIILEDLDPAAKGVPRRGRPVRHCAHVHASMVWWAVHVKLNEP